MTKKKNYSDWSKEELIDEVNALIKQKTYGLVWEKDKSKEVFDYYINWDGIKNKEAFPDTEGKFPVLKEVKGKEITTDSKNGEYNLLIEGDNYHSLAVLNFTHNRAIDVIYIDPPYNTGHSDFRYNDRWVDEEDGYRHSKWLSFMEKRLKLAKKLLKDTGVIFISIDDNEVAQLSLLCDELFNEKNVELYVWNVVDDTEGAMPKTAQHTVRKEHEYLIACFKDKRKIKFNKYSEFSYVDMDEWENADNDRRGDWMSGNISRGENGNPGKNYFEIKTPKGNKYLRNWAISEDEYKKLLEDGRIYFSKNGTGVPRKKIFKNEQQLVTQSSIFSGLKSSISGKNIIIEMLGECEFQHPKPVELIKRLIKISSDNDSIILDFFAGTGTTGHATMQLNQEDKGKRTFILCTNNEVSDKKERELGEKGIKKGSEEYEKEGICQKICYPRLEKAINGYNTPDSIKVNGLGGNLKYFKNDFVDAISTDKNKKRIVDKSAAMICIKENAFEEVKDHGDDYKIFKNHSLNLGIIFNEESIDDFVKVAKDIKGKFHIYVFSLDDTVPEHEFRELKNRVTLCAIPEAILHVYRQVFKYG